MNYNIVKRLLIDRWDKSITPEIRQTMKDAADEIQRLQNELSTLKKTVKNGL